MRAGMAPRLLIWLGIAACLSQTALLSGLNPTIFSVERLLRGIAQR